MEVCSTNLENKEKLTSANFFPTIQEIYKKSIINWDDYYESMVVMEVRTSNNFEQIQKMTFAQFTAKIAYLNKYIEAENNAGNANGESDEQKKMMDNYKGMMNSAQSNFKTLKFKKP